MNKKPPTALRAATGKPRSAGLKNAPRKPAPRRKTRIALAMAGGGPLGAIYEIGTLTALSEVLRGVDLNHLDMYVGVSAGGIVGAGLANGITPRDMCAMFIEPQSIAADGHAGERFDPAVLMRPALHEFGQRLGKVPRLLAQSVWHYLTDRRSQGWIDSFGRLTQALPAGLFSNQGLLDYLTATFTKPGRSNDFRDLKAKLFLVATDLDSGAAVAFGAPGHDHVPIAHAAAASSALPGLFPPVQIDGRCYLDGALKRTLHASVALKAGADLVLCLNPIVPYDDRAAKRPPGTDGPLHPAGAASTAGSARQSRHQPRPLIEGGLPVVLSQTLRAMVHSRMEIGMRQYADDYGHADVVLFEPGAADAEMFFTNAFSYASRRRLCEHAYQQTRESLWQRRSELAPILARHGITLDLAVLRDRSRRLVQRAAPAPRKNTPLNMGNVAARLSAHLGELEQLVQQRTVQREQKEQREQRALRPPPSAILPA